MVDDSHFSSFGLVGQILKFPLKCSTTSKQGGFVVADNVFNTPMMVLSEFTLGAVATSSGRTFHNVVTLSEKRLYEHVLEIVSSYDPLFLSR